MKIFSLHQGGVVMSSLSTDCQSSNIHPLAHIYKRTNKITQDRQKAVPRKKVAEQQKSDTKITQ